MIDTWETEGGTWGELYRIELQKGWLLTAYNHLHGLHHGSWFLCITLQNGVMLVSLSTTHSSPTGLKLRYCMWRGWGKGWQRHRGLPKITSSVNVLGKD